MPARAKIAAAALSVALATSACGGPAASLYGVIRSGTIPGAVIASATKGERLSSGPRPVYTYVVTSPSGTFSFSDDTPHLGGTMHKIAAWVYTVTTTVCHHR